MHPNKIIRTVAIWYVVLYLLIYFIASGARLTPGGDAAGNGMERGLLMLTVMAVFFIIAIVITVTNYFILKKVTDPGIKFLACIPILTSLAHILYISVFG